MAKRTTESLSPRPRQGAKGGKATVRKYGHGHMRSYRQGRLFGQVRGPRFGFMGGLGPRCGPPLAQPQRETARPRRLPRIRCSRNYGHDRAPDDETESGGHRS